MLAEHHNRFFIVDEFIPITATCDLPYPVEAASGEFVPDECYAEILPYAYDWPTILRLRA